MNRTSIEWTDFTVNPLKYRNAAGDVVWGCVKVSAGCTHCYAEALAHRYRRGGPFNAGVMESLTPFLDENELHRMLTYKPAAGQRVFVGDMTDVFGEWVPDALLDRLFAVFAFRSDVTWQVLSKRPARMRDYISDITRRWDRLVDAARAMGRGLMFEGHRLFDVPLPNVWLGTSVENQAAADERIPHLLATPAAIRFISAEPLLGSIELSGQLCEWLNLNPQKPEYGAKIPRLDWVIVGGESGPGARSCRIAWIRDIVAQCRAAGTSVFVKQAGSKPEGDERPPDRIDPVTGARTLTVMEVVEIRDRKGADITEWPEGLRVRQFPQVTDQAVPE